MNELTEHLQRMCASLADCVPNYMVMVETLPQTVEHIAVISDDEIREVMAAEPRIVAVLYRHCEAMRQNEIAYRQVRRAIIRRHARLSGIVKDPNKESE